VLLERLGILQTQLSVTTGEIGDTSLKKSNEGPFLKLTESAVAKRKFFEKQGLKFKRPLSAGTFCIFKP
jgi:hypothetical protein